MAGGKFEKKNSVVPQPMNDYNTNTSEDSMYEDILNQIQIDEEKIEQKELYPELDNLTIENLPKQNVDDDELKSEIPKVANRYLPIVAICCVALLLIGAVVYYFLGAGRGTRRIIDNVYVAGVNVGGLMYPSEAVHAVEEAIGYAYSQDMVLNMGGVKVTLRASDTKANLDVRAAVAAAYDLGHTGTEAECRQTIAEAKANGITVDLHPYLIIDKSYIRKVLNTRADLLNFGFVQSGYSLEGRTPPLDSSNFTPSAPTQTLVLTIGNPGSHHELEDALEEILDAYCERDFSLDFSKTEDTFYPDPLDLEAILRTVSISPINATIAKDPVTQELTLIPGSYGYTFSLENAKAAVDKANYGDSIRITMEYVQPDVTPYDVYFHDELSCIEIPLEKGTTPYLRTVCQVISGSIIQPSMRFSFNSTVNSAAERLNFTEDDFAAMYCAEGIPEDHGVCITASGLYQSALCAGLRILESSYHKYVPEFVTPGLDVCVNLMQQDLRIWNPYDFPVMLIADYTEEALRVRIMGTETRDFYYELTTHPGDTTPFRIVEKNYYESTGLFPGQVTREGIDGMTTQTYRMKYNAATNEVIATEFVRVSAYPPLPKLIAKIISDPTAVTIPLDPNSYESPEEPTKPQLEEWGD